MFDKYLYLVSILATWTLRLTLAFGFGVAFGEKYPHSQIYLFLALIMLVCV